MSDHDWPDPDEVRRWLDGIGDMYDRVERCAMTVMVEAARAYLRMREEHPWVTQLMTERDAYKRWLEEAEAKIASLREQQPAKPTPHSDESIDCRESFDARDWARHFRATACRLGFSDMDEEWLHVWFANAIMRGWDEHAKHQPAEPALSIEQVIAACMAAKEATAAPAVSCLSITKPDGINWRVECEFQRAETSSSPEAAIQALGKDAIAKLRERHAADAAKLKELGVEP